MTSSHAQKQGYLARVLAAWSDRLRPLRAVPDAARLGYRQRVTLNATHDAATGWRFGLMRRDELIAIHDCPVHDARVRALVHHLARAPAGAARVAACLSAGRGTASDTDHQGA